MDELDRELWRERARTWLVLLGVAAFLGGGGFLLMFAAPENQDKVRERLSDLTHVTIKIGSPGSRIVVYEPEGLETY